MTGHAPRKYAVVHLRSWLVHCSASVKAAQPVQSQDCFRSMQTEHDMATDSDSSSNNSDTYMSDSDNC